MNSSNLLPTRIFGPILILLLFYSSRPDNTVETSATVFQSMAFPAAPIVHGGSDETKPTETGNPGRTHGSNQRYEFESPHMGTLFRIVLYAAKDSLAELASEAAFERIEELNSMMSDYLPDSELNVLSRTSGSGRAVTVSPSLFEVLQYSKHLSSKTNGAFDVTVGPYVKLWREMNRQSLPELPSKTELDEAGQHVGYRFIKLDEKNKSVDLLQPGMQLDLGGIAKGYATDEALEILRQHGIPSALVDGGGDIRAGEAPPNKDGWRVVIPAVDSEGTTRYTELLVSDRAIATSGDLFQFFEIDGVRYSHIIHPQTGLGITQQHSVTVLAPNGMTADSYASALSVLGPEKGIWLAQKLPEIEVRFVYTNNDSIQIQKTDGFSQYLQK
ncbi:MAG: FAD:protein FMN transferase [Balneolaceae bacterium]